MKKFLSLALALIMVLSLVTISAGATEYEDFTDKDEIQYEEAVAVLNKLGIITGYEEGDFRPEGELTRGAAAKIIVSLLIGPEAAQNLPTTANPYPDVPAGNVFAGVISYCKNEKIITGYNDGTFRPTGTLTGYAFAKMLLGALGFDSDIEGFTGSGWTMRVATLGNTAGLFDRISFKGGETVNRETACQLALNTLKATTVEYNGSGSTSITIAGVPVDIGGTQKWSYRTSNQDFATNIKADNAGTGDNDRNLSDWYTVEFGEEHFVDLRLDRNKYNPVIDDYGRPCVQWSYKRISIGKYPLEPDFSFTKQVIHALKDTSDASKLNALGMSGYKVTEATQFYVNGVAKSVFKDNSDLKNAAAIANYTDNGAQVYAYVSYKQGQSDVLSHVVVIQSQLMEVKKIGSDYVSLQMYDNDESDPNVLDTDDPTVSGYNQESINHRVADVEVGDNYYTLLSGMKVGDLVVVEPYAPGHDANATNYEVGRAYVPETVTGVFSHVTTHGTKTANRLAIALTVGGTKYSISQWSKDLNTADENALKVTKKDVTLYLDQFGYPMLGKDIGGTTDWMVISSFRQAMQNGYLVDIVNGYDLDGEEVELNIGPSKNNSLAGYHEGDLVHYKSSTSSTSDWIMDMEGVYNVWTGTYTAADGTTDDYELKSGNSRVALQGYKCENTTFGMANQDGKMKFIFVTFDDDHEVSSVEILTTKQNVSNSDLKVLCRDGLGDHWAQACVKTDSDGTDTVKAVVIKRESNSNDNLPIGQIDKYLEDITDTTKTAASVQNDGLTGSNVQYANNRIIYRYTATLRETGGNGSADREVDVYSYTRLNDGDYFTWSKTDHETYDNFYTLHKIGDETVQRTRTVLNAEVWRRDAGDKNELVVGAYEYTAGTKAYPWLATRKDENLSGGEFANIVNISMATITDKTGNRIESVNDLNEWFKENPNSGLSIRMLVNDNPSNDGFRYVYMLTIESETTKVAHKGGAQSENPYVYDRSIETLAETKTEIANGTQPGPVVPESEKFALSIPEGSWEEIVIGGKTYKPGDTLPNVSSSDVIKVKPATDWEIKDATLDDEGYYTVSVTKEDATIKLTKPGSGDVEEGKEVALTGLEKMTNTAKVTAVVYDDAIAPTLTLTAPDWAAPTATNFAAADIASLKYTVQVGNKAPGTETPVTVSDGAFNGTTYTVKLANIDLPEGTTVDDVKINATIVWSKVYIQYEDVDGNAITPADGATTKLAVYLGSGSHGSFAVRLPGSYSGTTSYEISGAAAAGSATLKKESFSLASQSAADITGDASNGIDALGTGYVTVKFGAMTYTEPSDYTISVGTAAKNNVTGSGVDVDALIGDGSGPDTSSMTIKVVATGKGATANNTSGSITLPKAGTGLRFAVTASDNDPAAGVASYDVQIVIKNGSTKIYDQTVNVAKDNTVAVEEDFDLGELTTEAELTIDVIATPVEAKKVESVAVKGQQATILFSTEGVPEEKIAASSFTVEPDGTVMNIVEKIYANTRAGRVVVGIVVEFTIPTALEDEDGYIRITPKEASGLSPDFAVAIYVESGAISESNSGVDEADAITPGPDEGGGELDPGSAAVFSVTFTYKNSSTSAALTPTWANNDSVTITSTSGTTNLNITCSYDGSAWTCSGAPTGYEAEFDGSTLTLTASEVGAVSATHPFGTVAATVTNAAESNAAAEAGTPNWTDGEDAEEEATP